MNSNPYDVLGVSPDAGDDEIKKKYRSLVKQYHPDLHPDDPEAARKMSEINAAYEQIKSGSVEQSYHSNSGSPNGQFTRDGTTYYYQYTDMEDILRAFFGGAGFTGYSSGYSDTSDAFDRIDEYIQSGDYSRAAAILNRLPRHGAAWYYYASVISDGIGNISDAVSFADTAVSMEPSSDIYRRHSTELHSRYGKALRRRRLMPSILSAVSMMLVLSFILEFAASVFSFLFR